MTAQLILAVRARDLPAHLNATGFHPMAGEDIVSLLSSSGLWLGPRAELEADAAFRQLIPYIILTRGSEVVSYRRATSGAERRLHGRLSIGLGGHIDLADLVIEGDRVILAATFDAAARREVEEEIGEAEVVTKRWVGLLIDDTTEVGQVHLGVVGVWTIAGAVHRAAEDALCEVRQVPASQLMQEIAALETWSAMLVAHIPQIIAQQS